jgi:hypothetical protein
MFNIEEYYLHIVMMTLQAVFAQLASFRLSLILPLRRVRGVR